MLSKLDKLPESLLTYADRNKGTLWQVIKAYRANLRQGTVGVKTRAMVKSTGKKPYKQKKTGSARRGQFVAPLHVGGGVAHGPQARDYREATPKKMTKLALGIALATRVKDGLVFLGDMNISSGKTKDANALLSAVCNVRAGNTLVCLNGPSVETVRAFKNIQGVRLLNPEQVTALNVLETRTLVATPEAFKVLELRLSQE